MSKVINFLIVTAGLCSNVYGLYHIVHDFAMPGYGGHFQFLTIIGLSLATLALAARILNLTTGAFNFIYSTLSALATPTEGLISLLYWPIHCYDKYLLLPQEFEHELPPFLDICIHLLPACCLLTDMLLFHTSFKRSPLHILAIYVFALAYYYWVNVCYEQNGYWVYPLLAEMGDTQRGLFFVFCAWVCASIYKT
ncbi:hypothetical protein INT47_005823, partial [Mucor saturninus]